MANAVRLSQLALCSTEITARDAVEQHIRRGRWRLAHACARGAA